MKFLSKYYGYITLIIIILLLGIKLYTGKCSLWLCGIFVITLVAYFIAGDFLKKPEK